MAQYLKHTPAVRSPLVAPEPGSPYAQAFIVEPMKCWRLVHDYQGQAAHCHETPTWTGRMYSPRGDQWWRVWSCEAHRDGLTGLREFGVRPTRG